MTTSTKFSGPQPHEVTMYAFHIHKRNTWDMMMKSMNIYINQNSIQQFLMSSFAFAPASTLASLFIVFDYEIGSRCFIQTSDPHSTHEWFFLRFNFAVTFNFLLLLFKLNIFWGYFIRLSEKRVHSWHKHYICDIFCETFPIFFCLLRFIYLFYTFFFFILIDSLTILWW